MPKYLSKDYSYNVGRGYFIEKSVRHGTATVLKVNGVEHNLNYFSCDLTEEDRYKKFKVKYLPNSLRTFKIEILESSTK